jgi:2-methylisocitrate lyase-like PEP mutase family enzyme
LLQNRSQRNRGELVQNRSLAKAGVAVVVVATTAGCAQAETIPRKAARLTIDGNTHSTRPPACSQDQSYRTIDIREHDGRVEAVVLLSGDRVIPHGRLQDHR